MRAALCVGINAYGSGNNLTGCINDAKDWKSFLLSRGYGVSELLDKQATALHITTQLGALVACAEPGERVVFTFSGHGSYRFDSHGDESDARDEVLCSADYPPGIVDDDIAEITATLDPQATLVIISDSCHSGTVARNGCGRVKHTPRFLPPRLKPEQSLLSANRPPLRKRLFRGKENVILLSGCRDDETSADYWFGMRPAGAFSHYALQVLAKKPDATPAEFREAIAKLLPHGNLTQHPQVSCPAELENLPLF